MERTPGLCFSSTYMGPGQILSPGGKKEGFGLDSYWGGHIFPPAGWWAGTPLEGKLRFVDIYRVERLLKANFLLFLRFSRGRVSGNGAAPHIFLMLFEVCVQKPNF